MTETQLLQAGLAGNKDAFAPIVERYQSLICAITYSATGDFEKSRELAQETFARAWESLGRLKDLDAFRPWLCRIARNLVDKSARKKRFDVINEPESPDAASPIQPAENGAGELAISGRVRTLVWEALEPIPERCREVVVFFYRCGQSLAKVAGDLDISEDVATERLSQGRKLLDTEVAGFVEDVLAKTAPKRAFTRAVIASLPDRGKSRTPARREIRPEQKADAASAAARSEDQPEHTPKRTAPPKPEERALDDDILTPPDISALTEADIAAIAERITPEELDALTGENVPASIALGQMSRNAVYGAFGGCIFGAVAWILSTALMAKDWQAAALVIAGAAAIFIVSVTLCLRDQTKRWRILGWVVIVLCVLNLAAINLRWDRWMEAYRKTPFYNPTNDLSQWTMNLIISFIMAGLLLLFLHLDSKQKKQTAQPPQSPTD